ncbi:DUF4435 domain-containing protein [Gluconobacter japonicus]|uniref:DUF4435 domain-containing protein n=1 Tax=Gluconobacter japonicus TaxID=376620 RepID=UPI000783CE2A|nr:DUF4435 domain-containing protein [Gluconobacter japonicus]KXV27180.1 hypothetical protein AD937_05415 [Gluconobacter japonicus]
MFSITPEGLSVENKFYSTDYVLYCEGESMDDDVLCLDELYWTKIFNNFGFSVKCKGLGSKGKLKEFSKLIKTNTENVIVAMDRDYDDFYESLDDNHKIIYTYGYSFENDVIFGLNPKLVGSMFVNARNDNIFDYQMKQFLMKIEKDVKRAALIDIRYIKSPVAFFDREKPLSIINYQLSIIQRKIRHI